ncbi:hypothetical protein WJX84_001241 [Apatococcus fuscideae]|uniref:Transmembrane protein 209 n=1 Tax=Apatococcus fuscideae TaxID=2026836 RepID=A0AAW1SP39_9CHLO
MAGSSAWNQPPPVLAQSSDLRDTRYTFNSAFSYLFAAGCSAYVAAHSPALSAYVDVSQSAAQLLGPGAYGAAALLGIMGAASLAGASKRKRKAREWQQELTEPKRQLLGLPRQLPGAPATPPAQQKPAGPLTPVRPSPSSISLSPPLRATALKPPGTPSQTALPKPVEAFTPPTQHGLRLATGASPNRASTITTPSSGSRVINTPEQLKPYLEALEMTFAHPATPEMGFSGYSMGFPAPPSSAPRDATNAGMAMGQHAPTYRPSLQPKRGLAAPTAEGGRLELSPPEALDALLAKLHCSRRTLEVWTGRLREWLAHDLLQPLAAIIKHGHQDVQKAAAKLGWSGVELSPLGAVNGSSDSSGVVVAARAAAARAAEDAPAAAMRQTLVDALTRGQQPAEQLSLCLLAVSRYQRVGALLKGEQPRGILPPCPQGYIASRIRQLAEGSCVHDFEWNGGGEWNGHPWKAGELPTDTTLIFYLFAAFIEAPRWEWPVQEWNAATGLSRDGPLYVGVLPDRRPAAYQAVLGVIPDKLDFRGGMSVLLGSRLGQAASTSQPEAGPWLTLALEGRVALTVCSYHSLFHTILLFLQNAKLNSGAVIGGRTLSYMGLSKVLRPVAPVLDTFKGHWFGLL